MKAGKLFPTLLPVLLVVILWVPPALAQPFFPLQRGTGPPPVVVPAEKHDLSPALRNIPVIPPAEPPAFREIPRQPLPRRGPKPGVLDPMIQASPGTQAMPSTGSNFEGLSNDAQSVVSGYILWPPDTNGDVGPGHYVQFVNLAFAVYDKNGGLLYGPAAGNTLWSGFGGPCEERNDGDPIVLYDHLADRWILSQFALPGPFYQCIAVSQNGNPLGQYHRYAFKISDTKLNDYPKFGVWPDGYYLAVNQYQCYFFCSWAGQGVAAFERDAMLAGLDARMVYLDLYGRDPTLGGMLPSDLDGPAPPAGTPNYFVQIDDDSWEYSPDQLQIWAFSVDWKPTILASIVRIQQPLPTADFDSNMCGYSRNCIEQPGTGPERNRRRLDAISDRLMYRLQYRNFGSYQTLVLNHTVDADGFDHAGIRWYELRKSDGPWVIYQQGTYAPDADHRWMGSAAMDGSGNLALGFSVSGRNTYPSIRYTGRLAGEQPDEMTQSEQTVIASGGIQTGSSRWGDYSMMAVDPTDDCTFWYTQEYYPTTSSAGWQTRIASFRFPSCGLAVTGADLSISKTDTPDPVVPGGQLTYTIAVSNYGPDPATDVVVTDTLPVGVAYGGASGECSQVSGTVTCNLSNGLLPGQAFSLTITLTAPDTSGSITNTATVRSNTTDSNPNNNTATAMTSVQAPAAATLTVLKPNGGETWKITTNKRIEWISSGVNGNVKIELDRNGGWETIKESTANDGMETWKVEGTTATDARIRISSQNTPYVSDMSDGPFVIK